MPNTRIYISYHKKSPLFKSDILCPIHVGRAQADKNPDLPWFIQNMIGDDTGDNISSKNPNYCELTAQYWAWKNEKNDFVGFFHYRRLLDFPESYNIEELARSIDPQSWSEKLLSKITSEYDIIIPPTYKVCLGGLSKNLMTNYDFYKRCHIIEDLDALVEIIRKDYPEFMEATQSYLDDTESFFCNIFVMRWDLFDDYCKFLFDILGKLESKITISEDSYQKRVFGFLSERCFNIYVRYLKSKDSSLRIGEFDFVNILPDPIEFEISKIKLGECKYLAVKDTFDTTNAEFIDIVFSTDNNNVPHCASAIASILLNCVSNVNFRFHILDEGISLSNKTKLKKLMKMRPFSIEFYDMKKYDFSNFALNRLYISEATYYRLFLSELLPQNVEKVVYLDCDIIVEKDIKEFWDFDITNYYAGVVEDEGSVSQIRRMCLPLENNYFNAGVLLLNIKALRNFNFKEQCIEYYKKNESVIILQDQDILNGVLNGRCKFLSLKWNTNSRIYLGNILERKYSLKDEVDAGYNPAILHYTDEKKPWQSRCQHPLKSEYWKYLAYTPFNNKSFVFDIVRNCMKYIYRTQKICNIKRMYLFNIPIYERKFGRTKVIKVCNIPLIKRIKNYQRKTFYFLGIKVYNKDLK